MTAAPVATHRSLIQTTAARVPRPNWGATLLMLFAVAVLLRVVGILWGGVHADENLSEPARMLAERSLVPDNLFYPPLLHYLNAVALAVLYVGGRLLGAYPSSGAFREAYFASPDAFLFAMRLMTVLCSAAAAPLGAMVARRLGIRPRLATLVGLLMATMPLSVWLAHFAKNDPGLASATLLVAYAMLRKLDLPGRWGSDVLFGIACAVAVSFKQSAVFVLLPLTGGMVIHLLWLDRQRLGRVAITAGVALLAAGFIWAVLNVGVLLDWHKFWDYQDVLAQMWSDDEGGGFSLAAMRKVCLLLAATVGGAMLPGLVLGLASPALLPRGERHERWRVLWLWAAVVVSTFIIVSISGERMMPRIYIAQSTLLLLLAGVAAASVAQSPRRWTRVAGGVALTLLLVWAMLGTGGVMRQAVASPISQRVAQVLRNNAQPESTRILAAKVHNTGVPVSAAAVEDAHVRHQRIAEKYGMTLPDIEGGRVDAARARRGYYVREFPWVIGGLENKDPESVKTIVAYAWPLQPEEWDLDYWLDQGFTLFVVEGEAERVDSNVPAYNRLHRQLRDRGTLLRQFDDVRPLFEEKPVKVYRVGEGRGSRQ